MFFLPTNINIADIKLNNLDHGSSLSLSSTLKQNRNVAAKKNQAFGQQFGDECLRIYTKGTTFDDDVEDANAQKGIGKPF
ncbi:hypothetical protein M3182_21605 [Mesobacillus maritimus]|uniref:hypothetical protein n=1 Tax=Mesobacillus maritimus TaxID=1643336 RepID=UPI0020416DFF|nr:hypothetical protein [Mesobacillus maritimus]MCM3588304.1 hypothetical protein [Mesobacillus maritimus]MCM3672081.1 hypothetical protein [Mesobacillus maritimus]